ncbi:FAD dependent oxidoreductase [Neohortaea acidophila]|uniref:FAD dependent oxidoreductase n=1 Tax=Neohortaea acidophila TaxID=245834 RepID=A0A6A6Q5K9_9PEZI|nr:FAD dependent oxidoreductase [Neohortaea acidophila]KAF2487670.1 FAD dependent oxidoreductase [Neohortaea acidophila]
MAAVANGGSTTAVAKGSSEGPSTVIIGAGIIGSATAYYLAGSGNTRPESIHLVEASPELFASASGKAGGFCVSDWFETATASLGSLSFRLHKELADRHDGFTNWGYSRSTATSFVEGRQLHTTSDDWLAEGGSRAQQAGEHFISDADGAPAWLTRGRGSRSEIIGDEGGVAQVLSQSLLRLSTSAGVKLHHPAKPTKIDTDEAGNITSVQIQTPDGATQSIPCTRLLITAGAWTPSVFTTLFPSSKLRLGIQPLAGYSLVVKSPRWTRELESKGCHAIFTSMQGGISPEIFSRVGEEIYVAGLNDAQLPLPELATDAKVDAASIAELRRISEKF